MKKIFMLFIVIVLGLFITSCVDNGEEKRGEDIIDGPMGYLAETTIFSKEFDATFYNGTYATGEVSFKVDYSFFLGDNTVYNNDIALFGTALCNDLSDEWQTSIKGVTYKDRLDKTILLNEVGLLDPVVTDLSDNNYEVDENDTSRFGMGHYPIVKNNKRYEVVVVSIAPTMGNEAWLSNLDIGAVTTGYDTNYGLNHPDWVNKENHKGFDVASNRIKAYLDSYIAKIPYNPNIILFITGYSRGAAIANIMSADYTKNSNYKVFGYTFETPNTVCTTSDTVTDYKNIFNICTSRDIITFVPLASWGFKRYGVDMIMDVNPTTFNTLTSDTYKQTSEDAFSHIDILSCTREEIYDKEVVLYDAMEASNGVKTLVEYNYNEFSRLINQLDNSSIFKISELECVDEENELYEFKIIGSLSCLIEVITHFITTMDNMTTTQIVELLTYMNILNYYMPFFEDVINVVGLGLDKAPIAYPHYLLTTVSVLLDYDK